MINRHSWGWILWYGHGQVADTVLRSEVQCDFLVGWDLMLLQLFPEMWQTVIASCNEHLWAIFAVPLFEKKPICIVCWLQNWDHPWLLLLFGALYVGSELVRHLAELCYTLLQDRQLGDEGLRHELLILLRVLDLAMVLSSCCGCWLCCIRDMSDCECTTFLLDLVFWIGRLLICLIPCIRCRQRLLRGRLATSIDRTLLLRCLLIMFTELAVLIIIIVRGREKASVFLAHISRD